jgi:DHA2 family multidrug resistance protein
MRADHAKFDNSRSAAGGRNPWLIALVVSIATFMLVLDTSIANGAALHRRKPCGRRR